MDGKRETPSAEERAKARHRRILDRLNSIDTGPHRSDAEQEERRAGEIDVAREKERRPYPGGMDAGGGFGGG